MLSLKGYHIQMISNSHFTFLDDLKGKLLIASPKLHGSYFEKAIIYLCEYNQFGAMGLVINHILPESRKKLVFNQFDIPSVDYEQFPNLHLGGPVEITKGYILHSDDYDKPSTIKISSGYSLTSSKSVLNDIIIGSGPKESIFTLGYAGWDAGQLQDEINDDSWLVTEASDDIIFNTKNIEKWSKATRKLGVNNIAHYSYEIGHA